MIILGTHGRTGLFRLLMGSVAESILRRAPCPVLVYREPGHRVGQRPATAGGTTFVNLEDEILVQQEYQQQQ